MKKRRISIISLIAFVFCAFLPIFESVISWTNNTNATISAYSYTDLEDTRQVFDFNSGWEFSKGEGFDNSYSTAKDASGNALSKTAVSVIPNNSAVPVYSNSYVKGDTWTDVCLPHTYNDVDTFDNMVETIGNTNQSLNGERSMYSGTAWYKKTFYIPDSYRTSNKKVYIEFEAARQTAQIWLNGHAIEGTYLNGFIAFGYDLSATGYLNYGANNVITVLVDNSYPYYVQVVNGEFVTMYDKDANNLPVTESNPIVWHDSHWHPNYGGLYRNSFLHVTSELQLTLPLYSFMETQGTYVYTTDITKGETQNSAVVHLDAEVQNNTASSQTFSLYARINDATDTQVGEILISNITLAAGQKTNISEANGYTGANATINGAHLWSPDYPYLYNLECFIVQNNTCVDNNNTEFGIRDFRATTDSGFYINENYIYLNGYGQRSTNELAAIGAAYPDWITEYMMNQVKESGANFWRWGHCAGSPTSIKLADRLGIIMLQPGVDGEGNYSVSGYVPVGSELAYTTSSKQVRLNAFRDMIIYFRNHASICFWELGNKTMNDSTFYTNMRNYVNTYDYGGRNPDGSVNNAGTKANTEDEQASTRLCGVRQLSNDCANVCEIEITTDGKRVYGSKPLLEGEYDRYEARRGLLDSNTNYTANSSSVSEYRTLTSERTATFAVESLYNTMLNAYGLGHMGGANWIYSDSNSHARIYSEVSRTSGEVDAMLLEKDSYYANKVMFTKDCTSYIIGHWNFSEILNKTKYVVSKAYSVKLFWEYTEGGTTRTIEYTANSKNYGFLFSFNLSWGAWHNNGKLYCRGYDVNGNEIDSAYDEVVTHGEVSALQISRVMGADRTLKANGNDYLILDIKAVDANGNVCTTYDGKTSNTYVNFALQGEGTTCVWKGGYNSNEAGSIGDKYLHLEAGITRVAIKTTKNAGNILLTATMGGLTANSGIYTSVSTASSDAANIFNINGVTNVNYSIYSNPISYSLTGLSEAEYSSVAAQLPTSITYSGEGEHLQPVSTLFASFESVGGTANFSMSTIAKNTKIYLDQNATFQDIPSKYLNAEFIKIDNSHYSNSGATITTFTVKQNCNGFILIPVAATLPNWIYNTESNTFVNGFTVADAFITSSDGTIYQAYEKEFLTDVLYQLGPTNQENNQQRMYVICAYDPNAGEEVVVPGTFEEQRTTITEKNSALTWASDANTAINPATPQTGYYTENVDLTVDNITKNTIHLYDTQDGLYSYWGYEFGALTTETEITFDYYMKSTKSDNTTALNNVYNRILLQYGKNYDAEADNCFLRYYLNNVKANTNSNAGSNKDKAASSYISMYARRGDDALSTTYDVQMTLNNNLMSTNTWLKFKIIINPTATASGTSNNLPAYTSKFYVYDEVNLVYVLIGSEILFVNSNIPIRTGEAPYISGIGFATGGTRGGNFYVANLEVVKVEMVEVGNIKDYATGLSIKTSANPSGKVVQGFDQSTYFYYMGEEDPITNPMPTSINDFVFTEGVDFDSVIDATFDNYRGKATVTIQGTDDEVFTYVFAYHSYVFSEVTESKYFYDRIVIQNIGVSSQEEWLYSTNKVYTDRDFVYDSVPYQLCGAQVAEKEINDTLTKTMFKAKKDLYVLCLVRVHDVDNSFLNGWMTLNEIVTLNNGWIYVVYFKIVETDDVMIFDYTQFTNLYSNPIFAMKSVEEVQNETFFYDDFTDVDPVSELPYGWDADVSTGKDTSPTTSRAAITYKADETAIVFEDWSSSLNSTRTRYDGVTTYAKTVIEQGNDIENYTEYAMLNKQFSKQYNKFTLSIEAMVPSAGDYDNTYMRFWLMLDKLNTSVYASDTLNRDKVAIETYLHTDSGNLKFIARKASHYGKDTNVSVMGVYGSNQYDVFTDLPEDTWLKFTFTVDTQAGTWSVTCNYYSYSAVVAPDISNISTYYELQGTEYILTEDVVIDISKTYYTRSSVLLSSSTTISAYDQLPFLRKYTTTLTNQPTVNEINNLMIGTAKNSSDYFKIREVEINQIQENVIGTDSFMAVDDAIQQNLTKYYEYIGGEYVKTTDTVISIGKTYYLLTETGIIANYHLALVDNPNINDINLYYELINGEYTLTDDTIIDEDKQYFVQATFIEVTSPDIANISTYYENIRDYYSLTQDVSIDSEKTYYTKQFLGATESYATKSVPVSMFHELTREYMIVLDKSNNIPTEITLLLDENASSTIQPTIVMDMSYEFILITVYSQSGQSFEYKFHLYGDMTRLIELYNSIVAENLVEQDWSSSTWSQFNTVYTTTGEHVLEYDRNYYHILNDYNNLIETRDNLKHTKTISFNYDHKYGSVDVFSPSTRYGEGDNVTIIINTNHEDITTESLLVKDTSQNIVSEAYTFTMIDDNITVYVTFNGAPVTIFNLPTASTIVYGDALSLSTFNGGWQDDTASVYSWENELLMPTVAQSGNNQNAIYTIGEYSYYDYSEVIGYDALTNTISFAIPVNVIPFEITVVPNEAVLTSIEGLPENLSYVINGISLGNGEYEHMLATFTRENPLTTTIGQYEILTVSTTDENYSLLLDITSTYYYTIVSVATQILSGDVGNGKQISKQSFIPFTNEAEIYSNAMITMNFLRIIADTSAFTIGGQQFSLTNALPVGTKIIIADMINSLPSYYYMIVSTPKSTFDLSTDFTSMGFGGASYADNILNSNGELRICLDFSNTTKSFTTNRLTYTLDTFGSSAVEFALIDRPQSSIVAIASDEREYTLSITNHSNKNTVIDDCDSKYIKNGITIYTPNNNVYSLPAHIATGTMYVSAKILEETTYSAPSTNQQNMELVLPQGKDSIGISATTINNNYIVEIISTIVSTNIDVDMQTEGVINPVINCEVKKLESGSTFNIFTDNLITYADNIITISPSITEGQYKFIFSFSSGEKIYQSEFCLLILNSN